MKKRSSFIAFLCLFFTCFLIQHTQAQRIFTNPLPIPYSINGPDWRLDIIDTLHNFDPNGTVSMVIDQKNGDTLFFNLNTSVQAFAYNNPDSTNAPGALTYGGPTFIVPRTNTRIDFPITNKATDVTTLHWHALNLPAEADGGPHQRIQKGQTWHSVFPVIDEVQTAWYHSHLMDLTTDQVTRGMAGMMYVQDPNSDPLYTQLPNEYGVNDIPLNIQSKNFNLDTITNPTSTTYNATSIVGGEKPGPGAWGMVNGVVGGVLHVPQSMVRLRMLNGATIKIFNIGLTKDLLYDYTTSSDSIHFESMWMVATGGGYLDYPRPTPNNLLSLGDRREFVVDFGQYEHGDTLYLTHFDNKLPRDAKYSKHWYSSAMMAFVVDNTIQPTNPVTSIPATLKPYEIAPGPIFKTRTKNLFGSGGSGNQWTIDGTPMIMNVINDTVLVNTKEEWIINNTTNHAHPWHIHKVQFQVVEYDGKIGFPDGKGGFKDEQGVYTYPNLPDELMGWKDVQLIREDAKMTYVARFDSFPSPYDMDSLFTHGFMYHCHILTHEDNSMMHQFVVVDSLVSAISTNIEDLQGLQTLTFFPNPASNSIRFKGDFTEPGVLRFFDTSGRLLDQRDVDVLPGSTVPTDHLPRGLIIIEYVSGNLRFVEKLMLE
ncbi:MAG: multicopper oxidase domain-containing protein [Bacteroidota bacterium]